MRARDGLPGAGGEDQRHDVQRRQRLHAGRDVPGGRVPVHQSVSRRHRSTSGTISARSVDPPSTLHRSMTTARSQDTAQTSSGEYHAFLKTGLEPMIDVGGQPGFSSYSIGNAINAAGTIRNSPHKLTSTTHSATTPLPDYRTWASSVTTDCRQLSGGLCLRHQRERSSGRSLYGRRSAAWVSVHRWDRARR